MCQFWEDYSTLGSPGVYFSQLVSPFVNSGKIIVHMWLYCMVYVEHGMAMYLFCVSTCFCIWCTTIAVNNINCYVPAYEFNLGDCVLGWVHTTNSFFHRITISCQALVELEPANEPNFVLFKFVWENNQGKLNNV